MTTEELLFNKMILQKRKEIEKFGASQEHIEEYLEEYAEEARHQIKIEMFKKKKQRSYRSEFK